MENWPQIHLHHPLLSCQIEVLVKLAYDEDIAASIQTSGPSWTPDFPWCEREGDWSMMAQRFWMCNNLDDRKFTSLQEMSQNHHLNLRYFMFYHCGRAINLFINILRPTWPKHPSWIHKIHVCFMISRWKARIFVRATAKLSLHIQCPVQVQSLVFYGCWFSSILSQTSKQT